jgi:hypothetical protein
MSTLEVDPTPGNYYVSVVDAGRLGLLAGPFRNHQDAINQVESCKELAYAANDWAWFYSYGTVKMAEDFTKPGLFNKELSIQEVTHADNQS